MLEFDFEEHSFAFASGIVGHLSDDSFLPPFAHAIVAHRASAHYQTVRDLLMVSVTLGRGFEWVWGKGSRGSSPTSPGIPIKGTWRLVSEGGGSAAAPPLPYYHPSAHRAPKCIFICPVSHQCC